MRQAFPQLGLVPGLATLAAVPAEILYIEDNLSVANGLRRLFVSAGLACDHAATARHALDYLSQHLPRLIVSDFGLPDMNGLELIKLIRADERTQALPFIVFSASIDTHLANLLLEAGATACCPKADVEGLLRLVEESLGQSGTRRREAQSPAAHTSQRSR